MKRFCFTMFICCIIGIVCISCTLKDIQDWNVQERLGDNYYIDVECKGLIYGDVINGGSVVIEQGIIDYAYDDRWIIAKTKIRYGYHKSIPNTVPSDSIIDYWLIDKSIELDLHKDETYGHVYRFPNSWIGGDGVVITKNVTGPLDSISFYELLKEKGVKLFFNQRKNSNH